MKAPVPTPVYRFIHVRNLHVYLKRGGLHAPNAAPNDGLTYVPNHDEDVQMVRRSCSVPCGPGGVVHDYVPFYFGYLSPMMLKLKTGRVSGYSEGQVPLIYLVSNAQRIEASGEAYVFSDGHAVARFTEWRDRLTDLDIVDWDVVYLRYWKDTDSDLDRKRKKQAEFLVHRFCNWSNITEIAVIDSQMKSQVEAVLSEFSKCFHKMVNIRRDWYYG